MTDVFCPVRNAQEQEELESSISAIREKELMEQGILPIMPEPVLGQGEAGLIKHGQVRQG